MLGCGQSVERGGATLMDVLLTADRPPFGVGAVGTSLDSVLQRGSDDGHVR